VTHVNEDEDELKALRRRAYARDSDIHLDPASLTRLRELEHALVEPEPDPEPEFANEARDAGEPAGQEAFADDDAPRETPRALLWLAGLLRRAAHWLRGLRRSTVLIALGVVLVVATLATVLEVVQRVQTDPLQTGATQVARLSVDTGYDMPGFFEAAGGGLDDPSPAEGFQSFHGIRVVVSAASFIAPPTPDTTCMSVFPEDGVTAGEDSFSGPIFSGCSAGEFPAVVQFTTGFDGLPGELRSAFPDSTGLQFVFDRDHDEVVIFSDR